MYLLLLIAIMDLAKTLDHPPQMGTVSIQTPVVLWQPHPLSHGDLLVRMCLLAPIHVARTLQLTSLTAPSAHAQTFATIKPL